MRAAPLREWAARIRASRYSGAARIFSVPAGPGDDGRLVFRLALKQLKHRKIAEVFGVAVFHDRLRFRAEKSGSSSRHQTCLSFQGSKPRVNVPSAFREWLQFLRIVAMDAAHFMDRKRQQVALPFGDDQAVIRFAGPFPRRIAVPYPGIDGSTKHKRAVPRENSPAPAAGLRAGVAANG